MKIKNCFFIGNQDVATDDRIVVFKNLKIILFKIEELYLKKIQSY